MGKLKFFTLILEKDTICNHCGSKLKVGNKVYARKSLYGKMTTYCNIDHHHEWEHKNNLLYGNYEEKGV